MRRNVLSFTKKGNDFITMERTKMTKWLYYYKTKGVLAECHPKHELFYESYTHNKRENL